MNRTPIDGERTQAAMIKPRMLSERLPHYLASLGLVVAGIAVLVWYYVHALHNHTAQGSATANRTKGLLESEMRLPRLGLPTAPPAVSGETTLGASPSAIPPRAALSETDTLERHPDLHPNGYPGTRPIVQAAVPVLVRASSRDPATSTGATAVPRVGVAAGDAVANPPSELSSLPKAVVVATTPAALLPDRRWLLPKGTFVSCILETAIDSTLAGLATCVVGSDVFGADGRVVLLERGTRLVGETRSDVRNGQSRVAVQWTEARSPTGVIVNLASPATDALGRTGVPGEVDRHTAERFGAAVLLSMLDAGVMAVTTRGQSSGAVIYNAQASRDVSTEALRDSIGIPPTVRVPPGTRLSVTVVRDLDFRTVYELAATQAP